MAVTLKDIASRVGKSVTTVSRALNDYDDVSADTKALIRHVAEEMGYTPNILAQRLRKRRADTIGLILPTFGPRFSDPFFSEFIAGIGNQAAELGFDLLVSTRPPGDKEMLAYQANIRGQRVDGFILVRTRRRDARIAYMLEAGFPFVAFGRTENHQAFPFVDEDGEYGMRMIVRHLTQEGHGRLAFIAAPDDLMFAHHRLQGFRAGLREAGIPIEEALVVQGDLSEKGGYEQARRLLDRPSPPTAIAACNDLMALGAISAARERGLVVGRDIAITGFDDIPMAEHSSPPLTTVHQPIYQIGQMVCQMLVGLLQGGEIEQDHIILKPSLVIRQSSIAEPR